MLGKPYKNSSKQNERKKTTKKLSNINGSCTIPDTTLQTITQCSLQSHSALYNYTMLLTITQHNWVSHNTIHIISWASTCCPAGHYYTSVGICNICDSNWEKLQNNLLPLLGRVGKAQQQPWLSCYKSCTRPRMSYIITHSLFTGGVMCSRPSCHVIQYLHGSIFPV